MAAQKLSSDIPNVSVKLWRTKRQGISKILEPVRGAFHWNRCIIPVYLENEYRNHNGINNTASEHIENHPVCSVLFPAFCVIDRQNGLIINCNWWYLIWRLRHIRLFFGYHYARICFYFCFCFLIWIFCWMVYEIKLLDGVCVCGNRICSGLLSWYGVY